MKISQSCQPFAISKNGGLCQVPVNKTKKNHTHLGSSLVSNCNGFGQDSGETSFTSILRPFSVIGLIFSVFPSDFRKWFVSTSGGVFRYYENYVKSTDAVTLLSLVLLRQNEVVVLTESGRRPRPAFISCLRKLRYENQKLDWSGKLVLQIIIQHLNDLQAKNFASTILFHNFVQILWNLSFILTIILKGSCFQARICPWIEVKKVLSLCEMVLYFSFLFLTQKKSAQVLQWRQENLDIWNIKTISAIYYFYTYMLCYAYHLFNFVVTKWKWLSVKNMLLRFFR